MQTFREHSSASLGGEKKKGSFVRVVLRSLRGARSSRWVSSARGQRSMRSRSAASDCVPRGRVPGGNDESNSKVPATPGRGGERERGQVRGRGDLPQICRLIRGSVDP